LNKKTVQAALLNKKRDPERKEKKTKKKECRLYMQARGPPSKHNERGILEWEGLEAREKCAANWSIA